MSTSIKIFEENAETEKELNIFSSEKKCIHKYLDLRLNKRIQKHNEYNRKLKNTHKACCADHSKKN